MSSSCSVHWRAVLRKRGLATRLFVLAAAAAVFGLSATSALGAPGHGRTWELVTPPDPNGAPVLGVFGRDVAGERVMYATIGPSPGAPAGSLIAFNTAVRGPLGWTAQPLGSPYSVATDVFLPVVPGGADEDLSTSIWTSSLPLLPGAPAAPRLGLYRATADGAMALLGDVGSVVDDVTKNITMVGVSDDGQHVVFQAEDRLLPADDGRVGGSAAYEFAGDELRLVGVDAAGNSLSTCGVAAGSDNRAPNAVSRDGRRIFVTSPATSCEGATPRVYLREDGATTTEISASRCARPDCGEPQAVRFVGATPSGSTAFMVTTQQLTSDDVDSGSDLYRYDVDSGALSRVSAGPAGIAANVAPTSAAHAADDGSKVYFVATGELVPGQGVAGSPNVYLADGDGLRLVATLAPSDSWPNGRVRDGAQEDAQITPDGERMLLVSSAALTADDTDARRDAYLFDADSGEIERLSGTAGVGNGDFDAEVAMAANELVMLAGRRTHGLSVDGRRVFFTTQEGLLPEDVNADLDVYEWADGDLALISSGVGNTEMFYGGASADGSSVFFTTQESLVAADRDAGDSDLYAARLGGGFPEPQPPPAGCSGEDCRTASGVRLSRLVPASVTHVGRGKARGLRLRRFRRSERRRMTATGRMRLVIGSPTAGLVTARALTRIGARRRTVARGGVKSIRPGDVTLRLRLSLDARRRLSRGHVLRIRLVLRHSRLRSPLVVSLKLGPRR